MANPMVYTQADFTGSTPANSVDPEQLRQELAVASPLASTPVTLDHLRKRDDGDGNFTVEVHLSAEPNATDQATLNALIAAHTASGANLALIGEGVAAVQSRRLDGMPWSAEVAGLSVTVNINGAFVDDVTTVIADPTDTKYLNVCLVYNATTDTFGVQAFEKTTGSYAALAADEVCAHDLGEWSVLANGTVLTEV